MKYKVELLIILFLFGGISGFLLIQPLLAVQNNIFLVNGNNGTPIPCNGNTGLILAQNLTDLCDVTILSPLTNQIIQYNGSQWVNVAQAIFTNETTVCSGQAGNYNLVVLSNGGNCDFKNLLAGSSISLSDNGTHITITNTAPESTSCTNIGGFIQVYKDGNCNFRTLKGSPDISIIQGTNDITIDYNGTLATESTVCTNDGHGTGIVCNGGNVHLKGIASGSGITITQNGTDIIVTSNAINESTVCSGQSGNYNIVASSSGGNCTFKNLVVGTGESISSNSTHITITNTSPESTSASNVGNGANVFKNQTGSILYFKTLLVGTGISVSNSTNTITFTNTGVISNSCSAGITCSGTNPSTFTVSWEKLCQTTAGGSVTTLSCSGFTARKQLIITIEYRTDTSTLQAGIQFNSDIGTNYATRSSSNNGADSTGTALAQCTLRGGGNFLTGDRGIMNFNVYNNQAGDRKGFTGFIYAGGDADSATAPTRIEQACKWSNTAAQITTITLMRVAGTGQFSSGTMITVWGYD